MGLFEFVSNNTAWRSSIQKQKLVATFQVQLREKKNGSHCATEISCRQIRIRET